MLVLSGSLILINMDKPDTFKREAVLSALALVAITAVTGMAVGCPGDKCLSSEDRYVVVPRSNDGSRGGIDFGYGGCFERKKTTNAVRSKLVGPVKLDLQAQFKDEIKKVISTRDSVSVDVTFDDVDCLVDGDLLSRPGGLINRQEVYADSPADALEMSGVSSYVLGQISADCTDRVLDIEFGKYDSRTGEVEGVLVEGMNDDLYQYKVSQIHRLSAHDLRKQIASKIIWLLEEECVVIDDVCEVDGDLDFCCDEEPMNDPDFCFGDPEKDSVLVVEDSGAEMEYKSVDPAKTAWGVAGVGLMVFAGGNFYRRRRNSNKK